MAIRKIIISIFTTIAAFLALTTASIADECITIERYSSSISSQGVKLYGSSASATEKLETLFNKNRARGGGAPIEASLFLVGFVTNKAGDVAVLVAIFDKNGCVIEPTITLLSLRQWVEFTIVAGVTAKDFALMQGA